jgi:hypothetical protein
MANRQDIPDNSITATARSIAADKLGVELGVLQVEVVSGGYSRNRRSLVGYDEQWLFVKEVDTTLLPSEGEEELWWLRKDFLCVDKLRSIVPDLVPEWSQLDEGGHTLMMTSYRSADGWLWSIPEEPQLQHDYIQAVVAVTKRLEAITFDKTTIDALKLQPHFRDELALDGGLELIIQNQAIRNQLVDKYAAMIGDVKLAHIRGPLEKMSILIRDETALQALATKAKQFIEQSNDVFGHCDVRSDNLTYNNQTGAVKFVDWNWASMTPKGLGVTEFLINVAVHGIDVTPWIGELNKEALAATIGFYAKRCLKDPLAPGSVLRDMQAQSAAVALSLYEAAANV